MLKSSEYILIKPPHAQETYTDEQLLEFSLCIHPDTGYSYFINNYISTQHAVLGKTQFIPYAFQSRFLDAIHNYRKVIALFPRQSGKTISVASYLLWYGMFVPDATILIAANKYSSAREIMHRVKYIYEFCPNHIRAGVVKYNETHIVFDNGSRIITATTTENTGRGMALSILYIDEFAFLRTPALGEAFWASIAPTLSTGGKCIISSTPNSDEDQFARIWENATFCEDEYGNATDLGINGFKAITATWDEHPERDDKWASEQLAELGEEKYRREILCEFLVAEETLISSLKLADLKGTLPLFKTNQVRWYKQPTPDNIYVISLDPAIGSGGDYAAIEVFEANTCEQVAEWKHNRTTIPEQIRIMVDICNYIYSIKQDASEIYYSIENNSLGEAAIVTIAGYGEENIHGYFLSDISTQGRKGFNVSNKTKLSACSKLKTMIETDKLIIHSKPLISELKNYVSSGMSYAAKKTCHDDLVAATLIIVRMMMVLQSYHPEMDKQIRDYSDIEPPMPFISVLSGFSYF